MSFIQGFPPPPQWSFINAAIKTGSRRATVLPATAMLVSQEGCGAHISKALPSHGGAAVFRAWNLTFSYRGGGVVNELWRGGGGRTFSTTLSILTSRLKMRSFILGKSGSRVWAEHRGKNSRTRRARGVHGRRCLTWSLAEEQTCEGAPQHRGQLHLWPLQLFSFFCSSFSAQLQTERERLRFSA